MATSSTRSAEPRIALVYDRVAAQGGAERVLQSLHRAFPEAPLFTSVWNPNQAPWSAGWSIHTSWLQHLPQWARRYRWWGWIMPLVFESFSLSEYDVVISVTGEFAKAVVTQPQQLHICYLLTPTRYLWSDTDTAVKSLPGALRGLAKKVMTILQRWDVVLAQRPDIIIPISKLVAQRCEQFYNRTTIEPVYPPFTQLSTVIEPVYQPTGEFVFTWGRHVAYKRFDTTIQAAVQAKTQLIIAGEGPETQRLKKLARKIDPKQHRIHFVGQISDGQLRWYLERTRAAVFPQIEDYGIAVGEAVLLGCPVIVQKKSGVSEILTAKHGILIVEESITAVTSAIEEILSRSKSRENIDASVQNYTEKEFIKHWQKFVRQAWRDYTPQALSTQERKSHV